MTKHRRLTWLIAVALAPGCTSHQGAPPPSPAPPAETSIKPGINERWKSPDIEPLIETLENEDREIYAHRELIAAAAGPAPGMVVADVGAGSGFMVELFAGMVGPSGRVYAVDINPQLMRHVAREAAGRGLDNVRTVVCGERSVDLPPASVDMVFLSDTYHHFEYPKSTMRSIHEALRPGGQLVLVEFHRIPGVSRPFVMEHTRAGQAVFTREIEAAGFELVNVHPLPGLEENYMLRFRRIP